MPSHLLASAIASSRNGDSCEVIRHATLQAMEADCSRSNNVEVLEKPGQAPQLVLTGDLKKLATARGIGVWHASLTHDNDLTLAFVVGTSIDSPLLGIGIDLTLIERFQRARDAGQLARLRDKILHSSETALFDDSVSPEMHLSRLWAIKEAVYKALPSPKPHFFKCQREIVIAKSTLTPSVQVIFPTLTGCSPEFVCTMTESEGGVVATAIAIEGCKGNLD